MRLTHKGAPLPPGGGELLATPRWNDGVLGADSSQHDGVIESNGSIGTTPRLVAVGSTEVLGVFMDSFACK